MFAFAFDTESKELYLQRSFRIKPISSIPKVTSFAFASRIRPFRDLDFRAFWLISKHYSNIFYISYSRPKTIYKGIKKLKPGHFLRVEFEGKNYEEKHYWSFNFKPDYSSKKPAYWEERIKDAINWIRKNTTWFQMCFWSVLIWWCMIHLSGWAIWPSWLDRPDQNL